MWVEILTKWIYSSSERISACHVEERGSTPLRSANFGVTCSKVAKNTCNVFVKSPILFGSSILLCPVRQAVKSSPFQGGVMGSNPIQDTNYLCVGGRVVDRRKL